MNIFNFKGQNKMISRYWKGTAKPGFAAAYETHLLHETFPALSKLAGFRKGRMLRRPVECGDEFLIVTEWETLSSVKAFAGEDAETAVVPESVRAMMVHFDKRAAHYEVANEFE